MNRVATSVEFTPGAMKIANAFGAFALCFSRPMHLICAYLHKGQDQPKLCRGSIPGDGYDFTLALLITDGGQGSYHHANHNWQYPGF